MDFEHLNIEETHICAAPRGEPWALQSKPHDRIGEDSTKAIGKRNVSSASTGPVFSVDFLKTNAHAGTTRKRGRMGVGF